MNRTRRTSSTINRLKRVSRSTPKAAAFTRKFARFPELMEEIEVLWELNNTNVWWKAEIMDISSVDSKSNSKVAVIRYCKRKQYCSVDYTVQFCDPTDAVKKLHHTSPDTQTLTPWRFPEEFDTDPTNQPRKSNANIDNTDLRTTNTARNEDSGTIHSSKTGSYSTDSFIEEYLTAPKELM